MISTMAEINLARNRDSFNPVSALPLERIALDLPCPCKEQASARSRESTTQWWTCKKCREIIDYGFNDRFYCKCGQALSKNFEFKCSDPNHGPNFLEFSHVWFVNALKSLKPKPELNILILGPTGVGKSTYINNFINYMVYPSFQDAAKQDKPLNVIGGSFCVNDENLEETTITFEGAPGSGIEASATNSIGQSVTQQDKAYVFEQNNRIVRLIDTPGVGDTRGLEQDKLHVEFILKFLSQVDELHAICIMLKPNETRLDLMFRFYIQELFKHMHKDAIKNIVFCFTNSRSTHFKAGESVNLLKALLKEQKVVMNIGKDNIYHMDNEGFKYLLAKKQVRYSDDDIRDFEKSYTKSVEETNRLLNTISKLEPHRLQDSLSLNNIRQKFIMLVKPIGDISRNLQTNIALANIKNLELQKCRSNQKELTKQLYIPTTKLISNTLVSPRTVCTSDKCVEYHAVSDSTVSVINYVTHCHNICYLKGVEIGKVFNPAIKNCAIFGKTLKCIKCGCSWEKHMHITYENHQEYEEVDQKRLGQLTNEVSTGEALKETIDALNKRIKDLKREQSTIEKTIAKLATFLKNHAIVAYNDAFGEYLEKNIELEKQKVSAGGSQQVLKGLEEMVANYTAEKQLLDREKPTDKPEDLESTDGLVEEQLFSLPLNGADLRHSFEVAAAARNQMTAYNEFRCKIPMSKKGTTTATVKVSITMSVVTPE